MPPNRCATPHNVEIHAAVLDRVHVSWNHGHDLIGCFEQALRAELLHTSAEHTLCGLDEFARQAFCDQRAGVVDAIKLDEGAEARTLT